MRYTLQFADDWMCLIDDHGDGYDTYRVDPTNPDAARQQLATWAETYALDTPRERRRLDRFLRQFDASDRTG